MFPNPYSDLRQFTFEQDVLDPPILVSNSGGYPFIPGMLPHNIPLSKVHRDYKFNLNFSHFM